MGEGKYLNNSKTKIISIVGPTASGKTKLSIALAEKFNGEIISADSMQVYKEYNILSAKPNKKDLSKISHHLIDILSVDETFSVAEFVKLARECISDISGRYKLPFLVGGTGLYLDSLIKNIDYECSSSDIETNTEISKFKSLSNNELMSILLEVDKKTAEKIHINDTKRLLRAVEFFHTTGYPISQQVERSLKAERLYDVCKIGLNFSNRDLLYNQINLRVDEMFKDGIVQEVKNIESNYKPSKTAQAAIGYKELINYINSKETLENTCENLKMVTRRYAKRQLTWFRRDKEINWINIDDFRDFSEVICYAENIIKKFVDE